MDRKEAGGRQIVVGDSNSTGELYTNAGKFEGGRMLKENGRKMIKFCVYVTSIYIVIVHIYYNIRRTF